MSSLVLSEGLTTGDFLVSEMPNTLSRDTVVFDNTAGATDLLLNGGTVYSLATFGIPVASAVAGNTGNGTVSAISVNPLSTEVGNYSVTLTGATTFTVVAPDGRQLAVGKVGTPYTDGINFTLSAGTTPFIAGDGFLVAEPAGTGLASAYTGALPASGITYNRALVPAGSTKVLTAIVHGAEVNTAELSWAAGVTAMQQAAALAQLRQQQIIGR